MPMNFPDSPSNGDTVTLNGKEYTYTSVHSTWSPSGEGSARMELSDNAPANPSAGDMWFNTTNSTQYVYYNDGSSSQWVGTSGPAGPAGADGAGGGGVTSYADITARNVATPSAGEMAWVISETSLYVYDGNEWDRVYSDSNGTPSWTIPPLGTYQLQTDGSNTIVSTTAVDPEGFPVVYDYDTNPATPSQVTSIVNNNDGTFSMTPSTDPSHAGQFTLRVKATDGLHITSKTSEIALDFIPQPANNIGFFNFSNPASYSGSGNVITNMAYGTPASATETIVPGDGGYLATGTTGLPAFKFMPTARTTIDFSASMGSTAKTVMVIFSAESAKFGGEVMWTRAGNQSTSWLGVFSASATGAVTNGYSTWQTPEMRVNGTLVNTRQTAYAALDDTGTKFNSVAFSGYKFNEFMAYNTFPEGSYSSEHEVLGFMMWDTILTTSELEVAHTLLSSASLTAPWAP